MGDEPILLVGDNPFLGISHLSQERARERDERIMTPEFASELVLLSLENGANGFTFSVSETTLSILKELEGSRVGDLGLHPIVPYAYEYVRLLVSEGGVLGLGKGLTLQAASRGDIGAIGGAIGGVVSGDPSSLLEAYLSVEVSRLRSAKGEEMNLESIMLHEVVTDVALSMGWKWVFETHMDLMAKEGIRPGFETRNLPMLAKRFEDWGLALRDMELAAPFNEVGFQMVPSRRDCEEALSTFPGADVIAINVLASGYLDPEEAVEYVAGLEGIDGAAAGVSREEHARETFRILSEEFGKKVVSR